MSARPKASRASRAASLRRRSRCRKAGSRKRASSREDPAWTVNQVWCALLGVAPPEGPGAVASALALAVMILLLALVIERRLRPVEIVS